MVDGYYAKTKDIIHLEGQLLTMERKIKLNELTNLKYKVHQIRYASKGRRNEELDGIIKNINSQVEKLQRELTP